MPLRLSQHSKSRKAGRTAFKPHLQEWTEICKVSAYDTQIWRHFMISKETFYAFLDRERYSEEQTGEYSAYLDTYKKERAGTRKMVLDAFIKSIEAGDTSSIIFAAKTYLGLIEAKDVAYIELKKEEFALKTKVFLTNLANKFNLNYDQLDEFADKYFNNQDNL
ncbi:MAG: hypothetical protein V4591_08840 [Bdellovibrionota bacterium]